MALLSRAAQVDRNDIGVLLELGVAYRAGQRMDEARYVLERALELSQGHNTTARLLLANVFELDSRPEVALPHYFRAILDAQSAGQWLSDPTTEPGLRQLVQHAMQYVATGRRNLFEGALQPFRRGINAARLGRVDTALATYLLDRTEPPADPRQRPTFLYLPGLDATCFSNTASLGWLDDWAARAASLDGEAGSCLSAAVETPHPSLFSLEAMTANDSVNIPPAKEQQVFLYQRGVLQDTAHQRAPHLLALIDSTPLIHIPRYGPDAAVVALQPGGRSAPRRGRTNAFCSVVVAFSGSAPLQVTVGGESRQLMATESLIFDPSFEYEYAASGDGQARALIFDVWHPDISPLEQDALTALTVAVVDFDARLQDLA
ncbi:MAG: aspartyl/asparaginyl beta-hydroxylase domain-containing protein [Pseudomonadota bacterium]|nr:aspartyl/asparaginyl beta-hydroxylase domain-containing protein [Pseudomonadota bacterium]